MKTVSMHRKYSVYTTYLDTMLEHSVEILEGESKLDAYRRGLMELDQIAEELRKEAHKDDYGISNPPTGEIKYTNESIVPLGSHALGIIDLSHEKMEIAIDNCKDEQELKAWKENNPIMPAPILKHYNTRMEIIRIEKNNKTMGDKNSRQ